MNKFEIRNQNLKLNVEKGDNEGQLKAEKHNHICLQLFKKICNRA